MNRSHVESEVSEKVGAMIRLAEEGQDRFRVFSPFQFMDGDHLSIVLRRENSDWVFCDEGHTYMHLTYDIEEKALFEGTREKLISTALAANHVEDLNGELVARVREDRFGNALFSFIQALLRISDVTYLTRERVATVFRDDITELLIREIPESRRTFDWHHATHDPEAKYPVDCHVNGTARPLLVFALASDGQTRDATITLLQFEKWGFSFRSLAVFEDQELIGRRVLSRFSDVCGKLFSNLALNRDRIEQYLRETIQEPVT